jgi:uncharacterized protein YqjF (DUF2071 family)
MDLSSSGTYDGGMATFGVSIAPKPIIRWPFLTATWSNLLMSNWEVDPAALASRLPRGTELDLYNGRCFVSIVAFQFRHTRVLGLPVPWHRHFPEVNLRFYVKRVVDGQVRRAAVFISEIVPRFWVARVANALYNEPYRSLPMEESVERDDLRLVMSYSWREGERTQKLSCEAYGDPTLPGIGTREEFIAEHYFGYTAQRNGSTVEYQLDHPTWRIWADPTVVFDWSPEHTYGDLFGSILSQPPAFSFVAEGSRVAVSRPRRIESA